MGALRLFSFTVLIVTRHTAVMSKLLDQAVTEARQVLSAVEQDRFAAMIQAAVRDRRETSCDDKGRWARIAERIVREAPLDEECAAIP